LNQRSPSPLEKGRVRVGYFWIMFYIVSYDIPDDRKRDKVAKTLLDFGTRVQYSVFECIMDEDHLKNMMERLNRIISEDDSIRIYALCAKCKGVIKVIGKGEVTKEEKVYIL
jgi:CRISPR-associated protein Cas2